MHFLGICVAHVLLAIVALAGTAQAQPAPLTEEIKAVDAANVTQVLNQLKDELAAFAAVRPPTSQQGLVCPGVANILPLDAKVTLQLVGVRQLDGNFTFGIPFSVAEVTVKGTSGYEATSTLTIPKVPSSRYTDDKLPRDMHLALALVKLRGELMAVKDIEPCLQAQPTVPLRAAVAIKVVRNGTGGIAFSVAPAKLGGTLMGSHATTQTVDIGFILLGRDGKPGGLFKPAN